MRKFPGDPPTATPTPSETKGEGTGLGPSLRAERESLHWRRSSKEINMAKVPDLFEDLKSCYSENEGYSSDIDQLSLAQKSFYDASYDPLPKECMDKFMSLSTSETSKTSQLTYKESMVVVAASGKILKRRRLTFNQSMTNDDLDAIANDPEEEILQSTSVPYSSQGNMRYPFMRVIKQQFILNDALNQSIIRDTSGQLLMATALNNLDQAVKFDMGAYKSNDLKRPVTLRISETRLFLSAQDKDDPVLLKEMPETPKTITDETNLLFFWETHGTKEYFESVAYPKLFIATKQEKPVHMASGPPSIIDFQILEH